MATLSVAGAIVLLGFLLAACDDGTDQTGDAADGDDISEAFEFSLAGTSNADACDDVELTVEPSISPEELSWKVEGVPLLRLETTADGVRFRAPAYHTEQRITVRAIANAGTQVETSSSATVNVSAAETPTDFIDATMPACGPFESGVASGDPSSSSVFIWTRWHGAQSAESEELSYKVATDELMLDVVAQNSVTVDASTDFTTVTEVSGLQPATTYYFEFSDSEGNRSMLGRTRTLPEGEVSDFQFAVASCSSLWSGYFNGYARLAEREDVDLVIHLGDLIYDFADEEELIRIPEDGVEDPSTLEGYRQRFREYMQDPDQRRARQVHPWFAIWDNHDSEVAGGVGADQAFREYVPMQPANPSDPDGIFRSIQVGDLIDILLIDALREREGTGEDRDILGADQWSWLENRLVNSQAEWHVYGTQKLVSELTVPIDTVGQPTPWNEYPESRSRFYRLLADYPNNLVVSGDFHTSVAQQMFLDAEGEATKEETETTEPVGAEFLPTSISRGNFDETLCAGLCESDFQKNLLAGVKEQLLAVNPHNVYLQLTEHGYGIVDVTSDQITAEYWYSVIRELSDEESLGQTLILEKGADRWTMTSMEAE
jgi:alkaline phosphatase D